MNELNAKVAGILGWTSELGFFGVLWHRPGDVRGRPEPRFDSDPALLPEMLAWLVGRKVDVSMCTVENGWWMAMAGAAWEPGRAYASSPTIFEAVARLVVAVAEEKP